MKRSIIDVEIAIRNRVLEMNKDPRLPVTFDAFTMEDVTAGLGDLYKQDRPFLQFHTEFATSRRVGPTTIAPTRYYGDLYIGYFVKEEPIYVIDAKLHETVANWFAEKTVDGVRFRTFTPYPKSKDNGFTQYLGVIEFDFELYRGA